MADIELLKTGLALIGAATCAWAMAITTISMWSAPYEPTELDG